MKQGFGLVLTESAHFPNDLVIARRGIEDEVLSLPKTLLGRVPASVALFELTETAPIRVSVTPGSQSQT